MQKNIVEVAFEFVNIGEIDTLKETFQAEVIIESKWATIEEFEKYDPKKVCLFYLIIFFS
jgi:hypothetical protein